MSASDLDRRLAMALRQTLGMMDNHAAGAEGATGADRAEADRAEVDRNEVADSSDVDEEVLERVLTEETEAGARLRVLQRVIRNGKYYYPATSHYSHAQEVFCDRCNRGKLRAVIGWDEMDLCLSCASVIEMSIFYNGGQI